MSQPSSMLVDYSAVGPSSVATATASPRRPTRGWRAHHAPDKRWLRTNDPDADGTASSNQLRRKAPWADLEVAIPERSESRVARRAPWRCPRELTHEQVGAVVIVQQVWGRNARSTSPSTTSASSFRSGTSTAGLAGTRDYRSSRDRSRRASSPKSLGRQSHRRSAHEKQQPASQTRSP